jgi:hypothetical protein
VAIVAIFGRPVSQGFHLLAQAVHLLCVLPNQFVSLRQLFSQDLILFSHSEQFFFDRHALTLLALLPFGKSPADLSCYGAGRTSVLYCLRYSVLSVFLRRVA